MKKALHLIEDFEGFDPKPYTCPAGLWTIGFGSTRYKGQPVTANTKPITKEEALRQVTDDLNAIQFSIKIMVKTPLNDNQNDALLSFIYNIGVPRFKQSTLLKRLNEKRYEDAAEEFLKWVYAGKKKLKGLERRRKAERELFLQPVRG